MITQMRNSITWIYSYERPDKGLLLKQAPHTGHYINRRSFLINWGVKSWKAPARRSFENMGSAIIGMFVEDNPTRPSMNESFG